MSKELENFLTRPHFIFVIKQSFVVNGTNQNGTVARVIKNQQIIANFVKLFEVLQ